LSETLYLLGAGVNRGARDWNGIQPPLTGDFFQQALRHPRFSQPWYLDRFTPLFSYIERYWRRDKQSLQERPFDLEECYTMLQLQREDAHGRNDRDALVALINIETLLTTWFAEFFDHFFDPNSYESPMAVLAKRVLCEGACVLTFNYDTLLERAIEAASGVNTKLPASMLEDKDISDDDLTYSHHNWNVPRAYGVQFDEVHLHRAGPPVFVTGERFYGHPGNALYQPPILKLHGSTNWFVHSGVMLDPSLPQGQSRQGRTLVYRAHHSASFPVQRDLELLVPLLVTPVLNKALLDFPILPALWEMARSQLRSCSRLVIAGYSFPPTDFHVRRAFREAFADRSPRELVIVNPDTGLIDVARDLCNFRGSVGACRDLAEFVGTV
jgi:hypothetical protein